MSCNVLCLGTYSTRIPFVRRRLCQSFCKPEMIWTIPIFLHVLRSIGCSRRSYQNSTQNLKRCCSDNNLADVSNISECEIRRVFNELTIVQIIFAHEYCWFHCYSHENLPNHKMFLSIFCNIWNSFLSLYIWSWFHWQFWFCFIVSNDKLLWLCFSLKINMGFHRSFTRYYLIHNGCRGSIILSFLVKKNQVEFLVSLSKKLHRVSQIVRTSQYQFSTLQKTKHGCHPIVSRLLRKSWKWTDAVCGRCRQQVSPFYHVSQFFALQRLFLATFYPSFFWVFTWFFFFVTSLQNKQ